MEVKESATSIVYMIDDRTGPWVKVQRWIEDQSIPVDPNERSLCREGMYVKAIGNIKTFNNQKSVTAFSVQPVTDFNEITYHISEVMVAHLAATRGAPVVSVCMYVFMCVMCIHMSVGTRYSTVAVTTVLYYIVQILTCLFLY